VYALHHLMGTEPDNIPTMTKLKTLITSLKPVSKKTNVYVLSLSGVISCLTVKLLTAFFLTVVSVIVRFKRLLFPFFFNLCSKPLAFSQFVHCFHHCTQKAMLKEQLKSLQQKQEQQRRCLRSKGRRHHRCVRSLPEEEAK